MYVNSAQKVFTYMGYYANEFARMSLRNIERLTRSIPEAGVSCADIGERVKRAVGSIFSIPLAAVFLIPAFACYAVAACAGDGRFEYVGPEAQTPLLQGRSIKVMSLNACFQDPYSPFTGGVVPPFEPVANSASRIAAIVNAIGDENPTVFMGQEFENLAAQNESIRLLQEKGFRYFLRDLGSNDPIRNNSGLFVASKVPLRDVEFIPYPSEDRANLAKLSGQGALTFTVSLQNQNLRLVNVHLNYGEGAENQSARNRQLTRHVVPLLNRGNAVLFGDLNFNTASVLKADSGLQGFKNELEGRVTCSDKGKHSLRGKDRISDGRPCADCEERIDGLIYDPHQIRVLNPNATPLELNNQPLSDHFKVIANLEILEDEQN